LTKICAISHKINSINPLKIEISHFSTSFFTGMVEKMKHPKFLDSNEIVARGARVTACPRPSSLHPSPRGEPLQLRALRGARRATSLLMETVCYPGIWEAIWEKGLVDIQSKFQYIAPKFKGFKLEVNISDSSQFNKAQLI
jgi:hypothetical protein